MDSSERGDCHTLIMGLDNASVVYNRVDNGSTVDNWIDRSGVVHRVDSGKWGVSESGVDKRGISFSLSLVNHVGKSRMASNARGSVADSWKNIPVQRATIGVGADHSTVVDRVDSSVIHRGEREKSGISFSLLDFVNNFSILGNIRRLSQSLSKGSGFGCVVLRVLVVGDDCLWCSNDSIGVGAIGQRVASSVGGVVGGDKGGSSHSMDSRDDRVGTVSGDNRGSSHSLDGRDHSLDSRYDGLDSGDDGVDQ